MKLVFDAQQCNKGLLKASRKKYSGLSFFVTLGDNCLAFIYKLPVVGFTIKPYYKLKTLFTGYMFLGIKSWEYG